MMIPCPRMYDGILRISTLVALLMQVRVGDFRSASIQSLNFPPFPRLILFSTLTLPYLSPQSLL